MRTDVASFLVRSLAVFLLANVACKEEGTKPGSVTGGGGGTDAAAPGDAGATGGTGGSSTDGRPPPPAKLPHLDGGPAASADARVTRAADPDDVSYLKRPIPVLVFDVPGKIDADIKVDGWLKVFEDHAGTLTDLAGKAPALEAQIGIEFRGHTSRDLYQQKPYGFETRDSTGDGIQVSFMGLPREMDWALHSCYSDKTCMRNALTYAIGREMGASGGRQWWAPRTRWVEVYMNQNYLGLYLLVETIKIDKFRLDLPLPAMGAPPDITGPYVISGEGEYSRGPGKDWVEPLFKYNWRYREPHYMKVTDAQKMYLLEFVNKIHAMFMAADWKDKYRAAIDVPSWIDYHLIQELANNTDAYYKSTFLYKMPDSMGGKLFRGPIWDFDFALGNVNFRQYYCVGRRIPLADFMTPMMKAWEDPALQNEAKCRWNELRKAGGPLDMARIEEKIDSFATHITAAKRRDDATWKNIGLWVIGNNYVGPSFADEVAYLKYWLRARVAWLDKGLPGTCTTVPAPPAVPAPGMVPPSAMETKARGMVSWAKFTPKYIDVEKPTGDPALMEWDCPDSTK